MDKFAIYELEINEKNKALVSQYLESIKNHVEKNGLDEECYDDIEEMFFEKLSSLKQINELNIRKIIHEVGEAEVIFGDNNKQNENNKTKDDDLINDNKNDNSTNDQNFYQKLKSNSWEYDNENAIVLGISSLLAKKLGLTPWIVRIIFLVFMFLGGISIWFYFLLGLILPVKTLDYNGKNITKIIKTQLFYVIKKSIKNIVKSFFLFFPFLFKKTISLIKATFIYIYPIFRFVFFGVIFIILAITLFLTLILFSLYFIDFNIDNVFFFYAFPKYFLYALLTGLISIFIFVVSTFLLSIGRKNINGYIIISGFVLFLFSLFLAFSTIFDLSQKYITKNQYIQETEIKLEDYKYYTLDLNSYENEFFNFDNGLNNYIKLFNSTGSSLEIKVLNNLYANDELFNKIKDGFSEISLENIGENNLKLNIENNKIFSKQVPFSFNDRYIELYIPVGTKISFNNSRKFFHNDDEKIVFSDNRVYYNGRCIGKYIYFDEEKEKFVCEIKNLD